MSDFFLENTSLRRAAKRAALFLACGLLATLPASHAWAQRGDKDTAASKGENRSRRGQGQPNPLELLSRMVKSTLEKPYLAREVTITAKGEETEQWVRWDPKRGTRRESLRPAAGDVMIDNYKQAWMYQAHDKKWTQQNSVLPRLGGRIGDILKRLKNREIRVEWVGQDVVAGRTADIVRVTRTEGAGATARRFWVDRATGIRLKAEEVGPGGRILSSSYFLTLDTNPRFGDNDFLPPASVQGSTPTEPVRKMTRRTFRSFDEAARAGFAARQPGYLPTGFTLRVIEVMENRDKRITQRYANGLTTLSLTQMNQKSLSKKMQEKLGKDKAGFLPGPRGGERAYVWRDTEANITFTLLGNLPDDQMKRIADSVK